MRYVSSHFWLGSIVLLFILLFSLVSWHAFAQEGDPGGNGQPEEEYPELQGGGNYYFEGSDIVGEAPEVYVPNPEEDFSGEEPPFFGGPDDQDENISEEDLPIDDNYSPGYYVEQGYSSDQGTPFSLGNYGGGNGDFDKQVADNASSYEVGQGAGAKEESLGKGDGEKLMEEASGLNPVSQKDPNIEDIQKESADRVIRENKEIAKNRLTIGLVRNLLKGGDFEPEAFGTEQIKEAIAKAKDAIDKAAYVRGPFTQWTVKNPKWDPDPKNPEGGKKYLIYYTDGKGEKAPVWKDIHGNTVLVHETNTGPVGSSKVGGVTSGFMTSDGQIHTNIVLDFIASTWGLGRDLVRVDGPGVMLHEAAHALLYYLKVTDDPGLVKLLEDKGFVYGDHHDMFEKSFEKAKD